MRDFRKLAVWEKSHELTLAVYRTTDEFSNDELRELAGHVRQVAGSISARIAEGCGYETDDDLARFLHVAVGSTSELEYYLLLAHDLGGLDTTQYDSLAQNADEVKRLLSSFIRRLKSG